MFKTKEEIMAATPKPVRKAINKKFGRKESKLTSMEKQSKAVIKKHGMPYKPSKAEYKAESKRDNKADKFASKMHKMK